MQVSFDLSNPGALLLYILPGFLLIIVYKFFENQKIEKWEGIVLGSITISYLLNWLFQSLLSSWQSLDDNHKQIILSLTAIIVAFVIVKLRDSNIYDWLLLRIGSTNGKTIWRDIFFDNGLSLVRIRRELHGKPVEITGFVYGFDSPCEASEHGRIVLTNYSIVWIETGAEYSNNSNNLLYIESKDILLLEVMHLSKNEERRQGQKLRFSNRKKEKPNVSAGTKA